MEPKHTVHKPVPLQLHGGLQPQRKNAVRLGQQAPNHLFSDLELNQGARNKSWVAGSLFVTCKKFVNNLIFRGGSGFFLGGVHL